MSLLFKCSTCNKEYEADFEETGLPHSIPKLTYMAGNKRDNIDDANQDCIRCRELISKEMKAAEATARQKVREQFNV